jgi:ABC-type Fe3+ transport system permease subunit
MNIGLVSYLLHKQMELKSQKIARDSLVAGVPASRFILRGLLPELKKDILLLAFYFFVLFFFSFSIPFLVGGSVYGGFEVFIYEKILLFGMWGEAIQYSLYLFFILLILSRFLDQEESGEIWTGLEKSFLGSMSNSYSIVFPMVPVFLLCLGLFLVFLKSGWMLNFDSVFPLVHGTWFISLLTGLQIFFYLSALSFAYLPEKSGKWLLSLVYPGWVIVGFAFLLLPGDSAFLRLIKISSAQALLYLPFVYRLSFHQKLKDLKKQMMISSTLPTPWVKTFRQVVFPQVLPQMAFLSGLCSLWAAGDFAITGLLIDSQHSGSLAYEIKELMSNYRLEKALLYMPSLLLSSLLVFLLFSGITYVSRSKDLS